MKKAIKITLLVALGIIVLVTLIAIFTPDEKPITDAKEEQTQISEETEKIKQDSINLIAYLNENVDMSKVDKLEVVEFNNKGVLLRITVPDEAGRTAADVVGKGFCILTVRYLAEKGYNLDTNFTVYCPVYSPYVGVTGREGMVTQWGHASYDPFTDSVDWKWSK